MNGMHHGDLIVSDDRDISGIVKGSILVRAPASVRVSGVVDGNIRVESGASARISGIVKGHVSGDAIVTGIVGG